jgi:hypothetical protein
MATQTASSQVLEQQAAEHTKIVRQRVSRRRRYLGGTLEMTLEPKYAVRRGLRNWPRIPHNNRNAAAAPMREIISLLRDPSIDIPDHVVRRVAALTTPQSPLYGQHANQARGAVLALANELRTRQLART